MSSQTAFTGNASQDEAQSSQKGPLSGKDVTPAPKAEKKAPGAFRTISEVADELDVQQHVLRFWETKFSQIRPLKRGGGRRYYRPEDLVLLKKIHHLLYTEGYTIKGVQKLLREKGKNALLNEMPQKIAENANAPVTAAPVPAASPSPAGPRKVTSTIQGSIGGGLSAANKALLQTMLSELKEIRQLVKPE